MTAPLPLRRNPRPRRAPFRAGRMAIALLGLVQLFVCAVVPFAEARTPSRLGAHIEQPTQRQHYVHDEAYCAACIAHHLTGTAPLPAAMPVHATVFVARPPAAPLFPPEADQRSPAPARAPPAPIRLG